MGILWRWIASLSPSAKASSSRSLAPAGPARQRRCASWRDSNSRTPERSSSKDSPCRASHQSPPGQPGLPELRPLPPHDRGPECRLRTGDEGPASRRDRPARGRGARDGAAGRETEPPALPALGDRKSTRLNSSHLVISYAVFCLKKKNKAIH